MKTYFWKKYRVKNTGLALSTLNNRVSFWKPFLLMLPSLITLTLFTIIPFILVLIFSSTYQVGATVYDKGFGLRNYIKLSKDPIFHIAIRNTLVYAILALPISLAISILISSAISFVIKQSFRRFWQTVFFLPYVTSGIAVSIAFAFLFRTSGGFINMLAGKNIQWLDNPNDGNWNAFVVILIRGVWGNLAFQILILTTAMLSVNPDLYKSASIDGSSNLKQFFAITLPSIRKTITFLFTVGIIGSIKTFPLALFDNKPAEAAVNSGMSIMLYIFWYVQRGVNGVAGAASLILFLLGLLVSFGLRKLVSLVLFANKKIGEINVIRKIENKTLKRKVVFKI